MLAVLFVAVLKYKWKQGGKLGCEACVQKAIIVA
jgi:hypothetical protein